MSRQLLSWIVAGVAVIVVFHIFPDTPIDRVEGYHAMQVAAQEAHTAQAHLSALTLTPTPTPFSSPQTCNPPTRSDCIVIIVQEGDTPIGVYHRAYPGCPFDLVGFTNLFTINDYQVVDHDDDKIPDFEIGAGDRIVVVPMGTQYVDWDIDNCR